MFLSADVLEGTVRTWKLVGTHWEPGSTILATFTDRDNPERQLPALTVVANDTGEAVFLDAIASPFTPGDYDVCLQLDGSDIWTKNRIVRVPTAPAPSDRPSSGAMHTPEKKIEVEEDYTVLAQIDMSKTVYQAPHA